MERLKNIKETLMNSVQGQMAHLDQVDTKELGEAVDMIKDLAEAIYYCTVTEAMENTDNEWNEPRHYYTETAPTTYARGGNRGGRGGGRGGRNYYTEHDWDYPEMMGGSNYGHESARMMRDAREGTSPMARRTYMETKYSRQPTEAKMKELEHYMRELSDDITEMIQDSTPEEKALLQQKLSTLVNKI